jgi:uridine kinase
MSASDEDARTLPFILGIVGDSGSGKSTVAAGVRALLGPERVTSLELDDYHRFTRAERAERGVTSLHPSVHDFSLMREHLELLSGGRPIRNRRYDHSDGTFAPSRVIEPGEVVLARGLLGYPSDELRAEYDLAVFLQPDSELLFRRKLRRDVRHRGYAEADVLKYLVKHLLDSKEFVLPQAERADLLVRTETTDAERPDAAVRTTLRLRRAAAETVRGDAALREVAGIEWEEDATGVSLRLTEDLREDAVYELGRSRFAEADPEQALGEAEALHGTPAELAFTQLLIADLARKLRRVRTTPG